MKRRLVVAAVGILLMASLHGSGSHVTSASPVTRPSDHTWQIRDIRETQTPARPQSPRAGRSRRAVAPRRGEAPTGHRSANWTVLPGKPTAVGIGILNRCETGGNYRANTGNGFYGAAQWLRSTWRNFWRKWGHPQIAALRPDQASPAVQDDGVRRLIQGGPSPYKQFPGCSRKFPGWWLR